MALATVLYDGDCGICVAQARRIARWDPAGRLELLSLADPGVASRFPSLSRDALSRELHLIASDGRTLRGARALRFLSRKLPRLYWLAPILHLPFSLPLWSWLYRRVARGRYRLSRTR